MQIKNEKINKFLKSEGFFICLILAVAVFNVFIKFSFFDLVFSTDSKEYIETAQLFSGQQAPIAPHRILKPLAPIIITGASSLTGSNYFNAFILETVFFYLAMAIAIYFFLKSFFARKDTAFFGAALFISGYPVLKYGLDLMTDTGAWFFFVLGIWLAYLFYKKPNYSNLLIAIGVSAAGFYWKEYSALNFVLLGLIIIFHPALSRLEKIKRIFLSVAVALAAILPWQLFVYYKYHYTFFNWYGGGSAFAKTVEYDFFHIAKSLFAIILAGWILVVAGIGQWPRLSPNQKFLLKFLIPVSFLFLFWGAVSSRLYYVIAPVAIIFALLGLERLVKKWPAKAAVIFLIIAMNYLWLIYSDKIFLR